MLDRLKKLFTVELLQVLERLYVLFLPLLVRMLRVPLLKFNELLANDKLFMELFDLLGESLILVLHLFLLELLGPSSDRVHSSIRVLRRLHFLV